MVKTRSQTPAMNTKESSSSNIQQLVPSAEVSMAARLSELITENFGTEQSVATIMSNNTSTPGSSSHNPPDDWIRKFEALLINMSANLTQQINDQVTTLSSNLTQQINDQNNQIIALSSNLTQQINDQKNETSALSLNLTRDP